MLASFGPGRWLACSAVAAGTACFAIACETADDDDPEPPACVETIDVDGCAPLYAPTFDDVFTRTLMPSCATGGGACHASESALGAEDNGMFIDSADATFARLLEARGDATFVVAGNAACSEIVVRLAVEEPRLRMPPGSGLSDGEVCSVAQWIQGGADR